MHRPIDSSLAALAVTTPITRPEALNAGPPELPGIYGRTKLVVPVTLKLILRAHDAACDRVGQNLAAADSGAADDRDVFTALKDMSPAELKRRERRLHRQESQVTARVLVA